MKKQLVAVAIFAVCTFFSWGGAYLTVNDKSLGVWYFFFSIIFGFMAMFLPFIYLDNS